MSSELIYKFGRTRSGKIVGSDFEKQIRNSSIEDIFDAYAIVSYVMVREKRKRRNNAPLPPLKPLITTLWTTLKDHGSIEKLYKQLDIGSGFGIVSYGESLAFEEFRDR